MQPPNAFLRVLICDPDQDARRHLRAVFEGNQFVEAVHEAESIKQAIECIGDKSINAIFIDPLGLGLDTASPFIFRIREKVPHIVFCLYIERSEAERQAAKFYDGSRIRFHHYYTLDKETEASVFHKDVVNNVFLCVSDVRVFSEMERLRIQRGFYLDALPPEDLVGSLRKFRQYFPPGKKVAFIMMKFGNGKTHQKIQEHVKEALKQFDIIGIRADDVQFHSNLLGNIQTCLHGCDFGIAIFERVKSDDFNPNVAYEVGYLSALQKPICLLKDESLEALPTDLLGTLYAAFDREDMKKSIKSAIRQWMARLALGGEPSA